MTQQTAEPAETDELPECPQCGDEFAPWFVDDDVFDDHEGLCVVCYRIEKICRDCGGKGYQLDHRDCDWSTAACEGIECEACDPPHPSFENAPPFENSSPHSFSSWEMGPWLFPSPPSDFEWTGGVRT